MLKQRVFDVAVVGGGIIGIATARELQIRHPDMKIAVIEKEQDIARHQTGNNSGVIHTGIYYEPGSLRARLCVQGMQLLYKYSDDNGIPYKKCGKLIVAVDQMEVGRLLKLYERTQQNNVPDIKLLNAEEIKKYEPNCQGLQALYSPHTGIIDYIRITRSFAENFVSRGGTVLTNYKVTGFHETAEGTSRDSDSGSYPIAIAEDETTETESVVRCRYAVTCGGLYSDILAVMSGCSPVPKIVPFRGDYLMLKPEFSGMVNGNIYPVPDPRFPFLGVHFTPRMDGSVWLGPNAVLAFSREGYRMSDINSKEFFDAVTYRGLRKLACRYVGAGLMEMYRDISVRAQVRQLRKFVPSLTIDHVTRGPSGVRAQALDRDGQLIEDFLIDSGEGSLGRRVIHVRNAPSPAATSSLALAKLVVDELERKFTLC